MVPNLHSERVWSRSKYKSNLFFAKRRKCYLDIYTKTHMWIAEYVKYNSILILTEYLFGYVIGFLCDNFMTIICHVFIMSIHHCFWVVFFLLHLILSLSQLAAFGWTFISVKSTFFIIYQYSIVFIFWRVDIESISYVHNLYP